MGITNRSPSAAHGFTLIELMVVIAIIAVLIGLSVPVYQSVQTSAKKTQAKNDLVQIVTAVNAFYTEYGRYPTAAANDAGAKISAGTDNSAVFNELRGQNGTLNTRQIVLISPPAAKDPLNPRAGVEASTGKFFDPFGKTYGVAMDADYDNKIPNPYTADTGAGGTDINQGAIAWSLGKDGQGGQGSKSSGPGKDDIISW